MTLLRKLSLLLTFYRNFWLANTLITLMCCFLLWEYGQSIYKVLFCLKAFTLFIIYQYIRSYKKNEFYYYQNLGLSKTILWTYTFGFDILAWYFLLSQTNKLR